MFGMMVYYLLVASDPTEEITHKVFSVIFLIFCAYCIYKAIAKKPPQ